MSADKPLLVCLMGPTASGKTDLAIAMAQHLNCELVSVDSALVYRGLDIGSAKPEYPHHLVDIRDPAQAYSAADFICDANSAVSQILERGKTPLLVGGTMLYFKAFLEGFADMPAADCDIRADIAARAQQHGWPHIHRELAYVDPQAAARIHPNHSQRLSRALEVYLASGVPLTEWHRDRGDTALDRYRVLQLAICPQDRAVLHARIARRFEQMLAAGLLQEVMRLHQRPDLHAALPAIRAVGYRQLWQYLEQQCSLEEAKQSAVAATRQLAKRQLTWLRKWPDLNWIYTDHTGQRAWSDVAEANHHSATQEPLALALNYLERTPL
jgi:tRNA dimethylallyltransferase